MKVISMLAKKPDPSLEGPNQPLINDGNIAINEVRKVLEDAKTEFGEEERKLGEAAGLLDIARFVEPANAIQLIGHGCAGVLSLGYYWSRVYTHDSTACQVLDSNPYAYYSLHGKIQSSSVEPPVVLLIGCFVGAMESEGSVVTGMALLADLEQMWKCKVYAADSWVDSSQFVKGIYMGPLRGSDGEEHFADEVLGSSFSKLSKTDRRRRADFVALQNASVQFRFERLTSIPSLGPRATKGLFLSGIHRAALNKIDWLKVEAPSLLALPELEFRVQAVGAKELNANMCCNGRLLRVYRNGACETFIASSSSWMGGLCQRIIQESVSVSR